MIWVYAGTKLRIKISMRMTMSSATLTTLLPAYKPHYSTDCAHDYQHRHDDALYLTALLPAYITHLLNLCLQGHRDANCGFPLNCYSATFPCLSVPALSLFLSMNLPLSGLKPMSDPQHEQRLRSCSNHISSQCMHWSQICQDPTHSDSQGHSSTRISLLSLWDLARNGLALCPSQFDRVMLNLPCLSYQIYTSPVSKFRTLRDICSTPRVVHAVM
jgi:hypothetical protein